MSETGLVTDNEAQNELIEAAIAEISHIATLPEVTMKIIQLVEDPDSTAQDLNKVISNDPALGARILKVVNSAFYGLPGQIGSINRAIVLLGLNAVKNIAIAASLAKLFRGGKICNSFDAHDLWNQAIASATATRLLGEKIGLGLPDEAFLAGLIHDIGMMVEIQAKRPKFVEVMQKLEENPDGKLREYEEAVIGADHEQFGAALCRTWKFPQSFAYVTGFHHHPWDLPEKHRTLASLVHVADIIVANLGIGFTRGVEHKEIMPSLLEELKLSMEQVEEISTKVPEAMEEASTIFSLG
ncbi:HDOD domain protein [Poriferisphaera corsica]|uniref:HDOD domain protein n=1 Tax=Poriferisphaera corsica TaxID=2528020 RepID=A0A517YY56_9BACT|nr:HDOD domain-containing protein [Poriferisphaera corsica]QDU35146.1 HDOD domain protein [Poriferisphaera corsica]